MLLAAWMLVCTVFFSAVAILVAPLPLRARHFVVGQWNGCIIQAARLLCGLGWRTKGLERLPEPPYVILSNHQSAWETMGFHLIFPRLCFVMKRTLLLIPFFGWGVATMGPITIDRARSKGALLKIHRQGRDRVARGFSVVVFPEGTRMPPGNRGEHNKGGAWLAKRLGVDIVPVALNSGLFWPKNAFFKRAGMITVSIGEPISVANRTPEELSELARAWIQDEQERLEKSP